MDGKSILRDVARSAGVSLRTASRVLNDDPNVAAATRLRVDQPSLDDAFVALTRTDDSDTDATADKSSLPNGVHA